MFRQKVIIMGAAGRDFHNFNVYFRDKEEFEVVAFTATQIPNIDGRKYPAELAGTLYPDGIDIYREEELSQLIKRFDARTVVFAYSDVSHEYVMHRVSLANAVGANFLLLGVRDTMIKSIKPVISICAVRTGSGKSQTSRAVVGFLKTQGLKVVAVRHPMPYGDLAKQAVQRFATYDDFAKHECTFEEREEYEPYIEQGLVIYAGVDYGAILTQAEAEADVIVWDGGNNDTPFFVPDLNIVVVDPHRPGHELKYYPGETNLRMADVIVINKMDSAQPEGIETVKANIAKYNSRARVIEADSIIDVADPTLINNMRVLAIEDGPTVTHGGMGYGAAYIAAEKFKAWQIVDPRPFAVGSIKATFAKYSHLDKVLPAMGYGSAQMQELEDTINASNAEAVVIGTPVDLGKLLHINKPYTRVTYRLAERGDLKLAEVLQPFIPATTIPTVQSPASTITPRSVSMPATNLPQNSVRHLLHFKDYTGAELREILDLAHKIKASPKEYWFALDHQTLVMLFQKNSTRTRVSFETGLTQLGGHAIFLDWKNTQLDKASLPDEARCLARYGNMIAARLKKHSDIEQIAAYSRVPVINMLCEKYHPCQSLADLLTIEEHLGKLEGKNIVYTGIANNVSNTLVDAGTKLGANVILAVPEKDPDALDPELEAAAMATGRYHETTDLLEVMPTADVVYTDTWVNMEHFDDPKFAAEKARREKLFAPYQVSAALLEKTGSHALIMHDLPAHDGYEITRDAIEHPNSIIFDQAENRLHAQKAVMVWLLQKNKMV